jgi:hypothetical protein
MHAAADTRLQRSLTDSARKSRHDSAWPCFASRFRARRCRPLGSRPEMYRSRLLQRRNAAWALCTVNSPSSCAFEHSSIASLRPLLPTVAGRSCLAERMHSCELVVCATSPHCGAASLSVAAFRCAHVGLMFVARDVIAEINDFDVVCPAAEFVVGTLGWRQTWAAEQSVPTHAMREAFGQVRGLPPRRARNDWKAFTLPNRARFSLLPEWAMRADSDLPFSFASSKTALTALRGYRAGVSPNSALGRASRRGHVSVCQKRVSRLLQHRDAVSACCHVDLALAPGLRPCVRTGGDSPRADSIGPRATAGGCDLLKCLRVGTSWSRCEVVNRGLGARGPGRIARCAICGEIRLALSFLRVCDRMVDADANPKEHQIMQLWISILTRDRMVESGAPNSLLLLKLQTFSGIQRVRRALQENMNDAQLRLPPMGDACGA